MRNEEFIVNTSDDLTWKQTVSLSHVSHAGLQIQHDTIISRRGVNRINTPRQEAFVMLNGVKHLRYVHVDVHEILRFLLRMTLYYNYNLWQWITPLSYEKVLNYAIPWGIGLRGAAQLFSFTYAIAWYDLCIYIQIVRYGVTVLQITVRWNRFFLETKDNNGITITK